MTGQPFSRKPLELGLSFIPSGFCSGLPPRQGHRGQPATVCSCFLPCAKPFPFLPLLPICSTPSGCCLTGFPRGQVTLCPWQLGAIWRSSTLKLYTHPNPHCIFVFIKLAIGGSDNKASAYNAGDPGSIPGLGRSTGKGNGTPLQGSCLENPMDGGA